MIELKNISGYQRKRRDIYVFSRLISTSTSRF
uniref:Uncharacterized protein n=1 Tax=Populus trichocarpa TaxID=3694 RepID=A0A3N7FA17_POPTR